MFKKLIEAKYRICVLARNVVNIDSIDNWLKVLHDFGVDKRVDNYLLANLKKYIINDLEDRDFSPYSSVKSSDPQWLKTAIERGDKLYTFKPSDKFRNEVIHLIDYLKSEDSPKTFTNFPIKDAFKKAKNWMPEDAEVNLDDIDDIEELTDNEKDSLRKRLEKSKEDIGTDIKVHKTYPDNYFWAEVISPTSRTREGLLMKHCLRDINYASSRIFSLRDPSNLPHATVEVKDKTTINQIKGVSNGPIKGKYQKKIIEFMKNKVVKRIKFEEIHDLKNVGLLDVDGLWYSIYHLPKNLKISGNLDLSETDITTLPAGLTVGGYLDLSETNCFCNTPLSRYVKKRKRKTFTRDPNGIKTKT